MTRLRPGEHRTILMHDDESILKIKLPNGIGYVEIRTDGVNGPAGFPVIGVDAVSETKHTPAADGRLYEPRFAHNCGVVLVGRPDPQLREAMKLGAVIKAHDSGDHSRCPDACPAFHTRCSDTCSVLAADSEDQRLIRKYDGD